MPGADFVCPASPCITVAILFICASFASWSNTSFMIGFALTT